MKEPLDKPAKPTDSAGELWPQLYLLWRLNKESELKLNVGIYINDDVIVLGCRGRVVHGAEAQALSSRVPELLPRARLLVLDLSQVESIDGAGLGELVSLLQRARAHGCAMKLAAPSKCVQESAGIDQAAYRLRDSSHARRRHPVISRPGGISHLAYTIWHRPIN